MTKTEYLEQICTNLGIDVSKFPDRLLSTFLAAISNRLGVMKDNGTLDEYLSAFTGGGNNGGNDNNNAGTGAADPYGIEKMLTTLPWLTKAYVGFNGEPGGEFTETISYGGAIISQRLDHASVCLVFLPWITEVEEYFADNFNGWGNEYDAVIFTSKTPPVVGIQGAWEYASAPTVIFVPDESLEAYKNTENLTAFAHLMKPLSEYNGEGYYGGNF